MHRQVGVDEGVLVEGNRHRDPVAGVGRDQGALPRSRRLAGQEGTPLPHPAHDVGLPPRAPDVPHVDRRLIADRVGKERERVRLGRLGGRRWHGIRTRRRQDHLPPMQTQSDRGQHQIVAGPQPRGVPLHQPAPLEHVGLHPQLRDRYRPQELHREADDGAVPIGQRRLDRARQQRRRRPPVLVLPAPRAAGPGRGAKAAVGAVGLVEGGRPHPRVRPGDAARGPRTDARSRRSGPG